MKVYIETFGCTFNQGDSQIMAALLNENKAELVGNAGEADVLIVNTCYVKHPTEQKVLNRIKGVQRDFPDKKLIVTGCMVEIDPEKLDKVAPSAGWIGPHQIKSTPHVVETCLEGGIIRIIGPGTDIKAGLPKIRFNPKVHICQICEGCNGRCTYCCTRFARGRLQSYPLDIIKKEVERAVEDGCVEIQLTAQDTAAYGKDMGLELADLINEVSVLPGKFRIRIGMLHPKSIIGNVHKLIGAFRHEKVYKFLHIPVQSGSDLVLSDMNREYSIADFRDIISRFREEIPEISIATDIIVGYPTETEKDFGDTLNLIGDIKPDFIHISKYRHRPMTESSKLPEIGHEEMKKRSKALNTLKTQILYENNLKEIGKTVKILITEKGSKGGYIGRTESYKPVIVPEGEVGSYIKVRIKEATATYLKGSVLKPIL